MTRKENDEYNAYICDKADMLLGPRSCELLQQMYVLQFKTEGGMKNE